MSKWLGSWLFIVCQTLIVTTGGWVRAVFIGLSAYGVRVIAEQEARRG